MKRVNPHMSPIGLWSKLTILSAGGDFDTLKPRSPQLRAKAPKKSIWKNAFSYDKSKCSNLQLYEGKSLF